MTTDLAARGEQHQMKKVLFLTPSLGMGGMERVLVNYANLFVSRGYDVTVKNFTYDDEAIVSHFDKAIHYEKQYHPVENIFHSSLKSILCGNFRILPWNTWIKCRKSKYLYRKYVKEKYDVEIAFFGSETIKIISGSDNENAVKIGWVHNVNVDKDIPPLGSLKKAKKVYNDIQNIVCVSEKSREKIIEYFGRKDRIYTINNPNDTERIREMAKEKGTPEKEAFTFVNVSRMDDQQKGYVRLLNTIKKLNDEGFCFSVWLVGDGADYQAVKKRAEDYCLNNVFFFGQQSNPYKYINAADMYLCASYFEGFSMVMMEAVILAKPQISTDVSGAKEMLGDSEYGLVVENSEEGLYEGMKKILSDRSLYEHYVKMANVRKDYLSEDTIMDKVESIINGKQ